MPSAVFELMMTSLDMFSRYSIKKKKIKITGFLQGGILVSTVASLFVTDTLLLVHIVTSSKIQKEREKNSHLLIYLCF